MEIDATEGFAEFFEVNDTVSWHVRVTDPAGEVVYDGPAPCPDELCTISLDMLERGELFAFEMTPMGNSARCN